MKLRIERHEDGFTVEMEREPMEQERFDTLCGIPGLVMFLAFALGFFALFVHSI